MCLFYILGSRYFPPVWAYPRATTTQLERTALSSVSQLRSVISAANTGALLHKVCSSDLNGIGDARTRLLVTCRPADGEEKRPLEEAELRVNDLSVCKGHGSKGTGMIRSGKTPLTPWQSLPQVICCLPLSFSPRRASCCSVSSSLSCSLPAFLLLSVPVSVLYSRCVSVSIFLSLFSFSLLLHFLLVSMCT